METTTKNEFTFKQQMIAFGVIGILALSALVWANAGSAAPVAYLSITPEAEKNYNLLQDEATKVLQRYCSAGWKPLAKSKALDAVNGVGTQQIDLAKMTDIANKFDCLTVKAPSTF